MYTTLARAWLEAAVVFVTVFIGSYMQLHAELAWDCMYSTLHVHCTLGHILSVETNTYVESTKQNVEFKNSICGVHEIIAQDGKR